MDPAASSIITISQEELFLFHKLDRDLYTILVTKLSRDPLESMQNLAIWIWLERAGFHNIVRKILSLPIILINQVANETLLCWRCILSYNNVPPATSNVDIVFLPNLFNKDIPSLQFFVQNRKAAIQEVAKVMQQLRDILPIGPINRAAYLGRHDITIDSNNFGISRNPVETQKIAGNNFLSRSTNLAPASDQLALDKNNIEELVSPIYRTLFVVFSTSCRVEEWELREFFTMILGDRVEAVYMQEVQSLNEQPHFARIVFHNESTIDLILRGATQVKFQINGKDAWARKNVTKRETATKSSSGSRFFL